VTLLGRCPSPDITDMAAMNRHFAAVEEGDEED